MTDDYSEGAGQAIPDGQAGLWRSQLDSVRNGGTRFDQERLAQVQVDEAATQDPAFQEAYQIAKDNGFELVPVTGLDYGGVLIGDTVLVSTDTARWGGYKATLAHEVFHSRVAQGEPAAVAAVAAVRKDDAAIAAYMDRLDRAAPNWYQEMFADARRRLGPKATAEEINEDILDQIAEEIAADAAMNQEIPVGRPAASGSRKDSRYRRLPAKKFTGLTQEDLDRVNAELAAMTKAERLKAVMQAKAKLATFRKGQAKASTIRGVVSEAEKAGEKEAKDAFRLLKAAIQPREKVAAGKALARLDVLHDALRQAQEAVAAIKDTADKAEEARRQLVARLFPDNPEKAQTIAQYRPVKLLDRLVEHAEKRIRAAKIRRIRAAMDSYSKMTANERSAAYRDLPDVARAQMDRWLEMANLMPLADVPTVQPDQFSLDEQPDGTFTEKSTGKSVGKLDEDLGAAFFTDPAYVDLKTLYETLGAIEEESGAIRQAIATGIVAKARLDASQAIDDVLKTGKLGDPEQAAAAREATGTEPLEKATFLRGQATKFRSIFLRHLGVGSHLWKMVEAVRKGDSKAKGEVVEARKELEALLKANNVGREEEHRWQTELLPIKLPGRRNAVAMTRGELISLYNLLQDPGSREILLNAGAKRDAMRDDSGLIRADSGDQADNRILFAAVERHVRKDARLLALATGMQRIITQHGDAANVVSQYYRGADEFTNPFYWPRATQRKQEIVTDEELMSSRRATDFNPKNAGLSKRRVRHTNPLLVKDAFRVFDEHMNEVARYAHITIPANELLHAMTTEVKHKQAGAAPTTAMRQFQLAFGQQYKRYIGNGIRAIMSGEPDQRDGSYARAFRKIGRRISGAVLALSPSAIGMNRYGGMANMAAWLKIRAPGDAAKIHRDFLRIAALPQSLRGPEVAALTRNGYLADRWSGKSLRLALTMQGGEFDVSDSRFFRAMDALSDKFNRPLAAREMAVAVAAYKALTRNGVSSEDAVDLIEQANRDTQNSTSEMDKSEAARELNGFLATYFPFTSQGLVQWDFYLDAAAQGRREGWGKSDSRRGAIVTAATMNFLLLPLFIAALMRLLRDEEPIEDPAFAGFDAAFNALEQRVPPVRIAGEAIRAMFSKGRARPVNIVESSVSDMANAFGRISRGQGNYQDAITAATQAGKAVGLPVGGLSQWLKVILAQAGMETEGMKDRREDRWFKREMSDLPDALPKATLNAQSDLMFSKAKAEGLVPPGYDRSDFRERVRDRYRGTVTDAKPKRLADY